MEGPVVVCGATGNMGGAAARVLLERGVPVRATTRNPGGAAAQALRELGAEVVRVDLDDSDAILSAMVGAQRVFSVQSWTHVGIDGEIRQGKAVAEAAAAAGVQHVVYGSAGTGQADTGVPHFDAKVEVEAHMRALGLGLTILRPAPFMELMTSPQFYPQVGVWRGEQQIVGLERPIPWVAVDDIGVAIANAFHEPERWIGADVTLVSDIRSLGEARQLYTEGLGRAPTSWPLPMFLVRRLAGDDLFTMWHWMTRWLDHLGRPGLEELFDTSRELHPVPTSMPSFFARIS